MAVGPVDGFDPSSVDVTVFPSTVPVSNIETISAVQDPVSIEKVRPKLNGAGQAPSPIDVLVIVVSSPV